LAEAGIDAPKRIARLRREGGVARVLSAIAGIHSPGAKRAHYEALLAMRDLPDADVQRIVAQAGRELAGASGDLRGVISKVSPRQASAANVTGTLANALDSIESDGDKAATVTQLALRAEGDEDLLVALMRVARGIQSDGDKARVLMTTAARYLTLGKQPV